MLRLRRPKTTRSDVLPSLIFLSIAGILAAIYYLTPTTFQLYLSLNHTNPQLHAFWTNALVHEHQPWDLHLWGNIAFYLLLIFLCWKLYEHRDQQKWFWTGFLLILTLGPIVSSLSSFIVFTVLPRDILYDRGFSSVVSAIDGFLIMSLVQTFAQKQEESVASTSMVLYLAYLLFALGSITQRYAVVFLSLLIVIAGLLGTRTRYLGSLDQLADWGQDHVALSSIVVTAALLSVLVFAFALPPELSNSQGGVTNVYAHAAGLLLGMVVERAVRYRYGPRPSPPAMPWTSFGS